MKLLKAYTLAEVLIVVAIIGVVAMLTVPKVMKNYRNKIYATRIRKVYAMLADAVQSAMTEERATNFYETKAGHANSCSDSDSTDCTDGAGYFLNTYFATVKVNCKTAGSTSCFAHGYTTLGGNAVADFTSEYCAQLKTGEAICLEYNSTDKKTYVYVDINSKDIPNVAGRDLFYMMIEDDGTLSDYKNTSAAQCSKTNPAGCLNKLMDSDWKMEY